MTRAKLTAAASRYTSRKIRGAQAAGPDQSWQSRAWDMYHAVPEVRFAAGWIGNAMSGATLFAGRRGDDGTIERAPDDHLATEIVSQIAGGPDGQAKLLGLFGRHLTVAGEGWILVRPNSQVKNPEVEVDGHDWRVLSVREVRPGNGKLTAEVEGVSIEIPTDEAAIDSGAPIALRVWEPDPERYIEADSPVRTSLDLLEEIQLLNAAVKAIARSRLTGRGILFVPKGTRFPTSNTAQSDAEDDLIEVLMTVAETAIKDPESAAATVPIILEVPADAIDAFKLLKFDSDFDELAIKLREEAVRRFAVGLEIPAEILLGLGDVNHWCTLPTVQIMTHNGWKTHDQLTPGEMVLTLNHETGLSEWQPLQAVNTWQVTDEPMVRIKGRRHSSLTTTGHRWPILTGRAEDRGRSWTTSGDLLADRHAPDAPGHRLEHLLLAAPHADLPTEPKYSDALVELVAWYFTEGSTGIRPGRNAPKLLIHQSQVVNPDNCARIERALTNLFGPESAELDKGGRYSTPESVARRAEARRLRAENPKLSYAAIGAQIGVSAQMVMKYLRQDAKTADDVPRWRKSFNSTGEIAHYRLNAAAGAVLLEHAPNRMVSPDFIRSLTQSQLELFLDTAVRGDGWHIGNTPALTQKDPAMLDAFELAAILSGRSTLRREHEGIGRTAQGPRLKMQHVCTVSNTTVFAPQAKHISEEAYTGTVWCPTTPNGTWLAKDDSGSVFYTGNSAWQLTEEAIRLGIEPRLSIVAHALTQYWLRPILEAEHVEDWHRWMVWYDTASLRVRGNKSETALQAHDRGVISDAALRRETGFDEDDAPTAEDAARRQRTPAPGEEAPDPELPVDESQAEPDTRPSGGTPEQDGLYAAADGLIYAALSAAGEKLRRTPACPRSERSRAREIQAAALHTVLPVDADGVERWQLLAGAWTRVPEIADRYGINPACLTASLDAYARELIAAGVEHDYSVVPGVLMPCTTSSAAA